MRSAVVLLLLVFSFSAFSQAPINLDAFQKRFKLIKNKKTGKVIAIKDRYMMTQFLIYPFLKQIKDDIIEEIRLLRSKNAISHEYEIDDFVNSLEMEGIKAGADSKQVIADSIKNLKNVDIQHTFDEINRVSIFKDFEGKLQKALLNLSLNNVAVLEDPRYFFRRNVTHEAVKFGLNIAKKRLSHIPLINFASYVIVRVDALLREQRNFSQNMLLYYLENVPSKHLGLTEDDVNKAVSSIYESKLNWTAFQESKYAANNWMKYGFDKFYTIVRSANNNLRRNEYRYEAVTKRMGFGFAQVVERDDNGNESSKIIHLLNKWHMFSSKPAPAYHVLKPKKILRERRLMYLAQAGIAFVPIPDFIKSLANNVINSFYVNQKQTEGALVGYMEGQKNYRAAYIIYQQNFNPFLYIPMMQ
jgi:hypothetical protein